MKTYTLEQIEDKTIPCTSFDDMLLNVVYYALNPKTQTYSKVFYDKVNGVGPKYINDQITLGNIRLEKFTEQHLIDRGWNRGQSKDLNYMDFIKGHYCIGLSGYPWSHCFISRIGDRHNQHPRYAGDTPKTPAHFDLLTNMLNIE